MQTCTRTHGTEKRISWNGRIATRLHLHGIPRQHGAGTSSVLFASAALVSSFLNCAFAKALQGKSLGGQSGSRREVNKRTPEWLWRGYKQHVGEGPVAPSGHDPLLVSLSELGPHASDVGFDVLVLEMLTSSDWDGERFVQNNGVDRIREIICDQTNLQYGAHIATTAPNSRARRLERIRQIQPTLEPSRPQNYSQLSRNQQKIEKKRAISEKYASLKREVQGSVVNTFSVEDRARLAVALALGWYHRSDL
jgi:hypothetical protein